MGLNFVIHSFIFSNLNLSEDWRSSGNGTGIHPDPHPHTHARTKPEDTQEEAAQKPYTDRNLSAESNLEP